MVHQIRDARGLRGMLQSDDGVISKVLSHNRHCITFETSFGFSATMVQRLKEQPEHIVFSERSRIARLGVRITNAPPTLERLHGDRLVITQTASAAIPGYPSLDQLAAFFVAGLPVGRMVFCDPDALLSSEEVMAAIERAEMKLPASTAISSDGSIVIAPHRVVCELREEIDHKTFGHILLFADGREMLNRYQIKRTVPNLIIPPGQGVITTCSMYLNVHYVVLQSGFSLGRNLSATVLDPIKTRGIRTYLEIVNNTSHTIVNPLISAKIYGAPKNKIAARRKTYSSSPKPYSYDRMRQLGRKFEAQPEHTCHLLTKPMAVVKPADGGLEKAHFVTRGQTGGPEYAKAHSSSGCHDYRRRFSAPQAYATSRLDRMVKKRPAVLVLNYFPNLVEHRDIINLAADGRLAALYFFQPSWEHGSFLSEDDHGRLKEYHAFGIEVYWVCGLNRKLMAHTMRDGKGYFVVPERLADFHKAMLFAFYGSNLPLSAAGEQRLGGLLDALVSFWGNHLGVVTGGGSGVMEVANTMARQRGILSGANFLEITDQPLTTNVDFCQVFQATCRHSRQKWFEIASFPIFNVGGLGTLEELGITLCNMKLSIMERVPIILFDTEGNRGYWDSMQNQITTMVEQARAPGWIKEHLILTDDPSEVIEAYRSKLHLF